MAGTINTLVKGWGGGQICYINRRSKAWSALTVQAKGKERRRMRLPSLLISARWSCLHFPLPNPSCVHAICPMMSRYPHSQLPYPRGSIPFSSIATTPMLHHFSILWVWSDLLTRWVAIRAGKVYFSGCDPISTKKDNNTTHRSKKELDNLLVSKGWPSLHQVPPLCELPKHVNFFKSESSTRDDNNNDVPTFVIAPMHTLVVRRKLGH